MILMNHAMLLRGAWAAEGTTTFTKALLAMIDWGQNGAGRAAAGDGGRRF
jgi:hypothetical protein